ncbi:putative RNA methyltransferase [Pseudidiomarina insulisalsae]|uniref:rRNA (Guanine-N1)-methyltransferase n=1 Tax=Pseudidiomarina insulisalsae TaxID=575789 RepID=A0A432YQR9_9GAMM|nr:methyltransferase domain-containing protein [Pseudidiomarina insulisalsae]RUO63664.1 rRNA (guanine-N1)-methyltransferase [Pseudidiomarina insulisalsae]
MTTPTPETPLLRPFTQLCCPLDGQPLTLADKTWRCSNGHSFDVAKQGYVNLLPVQNKRSKDPGDSKAMVQARADFLASGFYQPLAVQLAELVLRGKPRTLLDAGCGEGYYLRHLMAAAERAGQELEVAALDISKWAVLAAAKQEKRATWMAASNSQMPIAAQSIDALLCVFGFPASSEFQRVLKPGARLIMVDPASEHLSELKQIIYTEVKAKPYQLPVPADAWELASEQRVTFSVQLPSNQAICELLTMTPHLYRASSEGRARAEALQELSVTVDVWLREFTAR